jgi:exopolyphosphatase/guanosine-5'-triphosphate,3'-diphosphate pyrophosphatase
VGHIRIGVVDIGANTSRLLVARCRREQFEAILETRTPLHLGAEIEKRGRISKRKLRHVAEAVEAAVLAARKAGASEIIGLVTSPGRQSSNGAEISAEISAVAGIDVRLLTAEEEGQLAYRGVRDTIEGHVLVCDVGGGSIQLAAGNARTTPSWFATANVGSLRLTRRHVRHDPPRGNELVALRQTAEEALAHFEAAEATTVLVTGGTARALRKIVGPTLGRSELEAAIDIVSRMSAKKLARTYEIPTWRAETLPAGAIIASVLTDRLERSLEVANNGIREGAILEMHEAIRETRRLNSAAA